MADVLIEAKRSNDLENMLQTYDVMVVLKKHPGTTPAAIRFIGRKRREMTLPLPAVNDTPELRSDLAELKTKWAGMDRAEYLAKMAYSEYLLTAEWNEIRTRKLESVGYACQMCNASGVLLDVHHRTYERRGRERDEDLTVLCRDCHEAFHASRKLAK